MLIMVNKGKKMKLDTVIAVRKNKKIYRDNDKVIKLFDMIF